MKALRCVEDERSQTEHLRKKNYHFSFSRLSPFRASPGGRTEQLTRGVVIHPVTSPLSVPPLSLSLSVNRIIQQLLVSSVTAAPSQLPPLAPASVQPYHWSVLLPNKEAPFHWARYRQHVLWWRGLGLAVANGNFRPAP